MSLHSRLCSPCELRFWPKKNTVAAKYGGTLSFPDSPDEIPYRWLYELAAPKQTRETLGQQAENSRLFKALDTALKENPLPPFAVLRRYLAPGGAVVVDDQTGLHYMAFTLRRETD